MLLRPAILLSALAALVVPIDAWAQRVPFELTFDVANPTLDVTTIRGRIEVIPGDEGRVRVMGLATVRVGFDVPANALELAKRVAAQPPVRLDGTTVRLSPPASDEERRAMTLSYAVRVPRNTIVHATSDSGATAISGVAGAVTVRTQSSAIVLRDLGGAATVTTQSGEVNADGVGGDVSVKTGSSAVTARGLGAGLKVRTQSGAVSAGFRGTGSADVETGSSSIDLLDLMGGLVAGTQSGRVRVSGAPGSPWQISTGSSAIELTLVGEPHLNLDASTRSGSVRLEGLDVAGLSSKSAASGAVGGGGPLLRASSRSGSIRISR